MKYISHRGNTHGMSKKENHPDQIAFCIKQGYDVEIDIRLINNILYLGHDEPLYEISDMFLINHRESLWIHCKNLEAIRFMQQYENLNYFWHQTDDFTLTSKKNIWTYPGKNITSNSVIVCESKKETKQVIENKKVYGICSDYLGFFI